MSEPRQSSALALFRLPSMQNLVSAGRSNTPGDVNSSGNSFSAQLSSATEQSKKSMAQPVENERRSPGKKIESASSDRNQVDVSDKSSRSTEDSRVSERSGMNDESTGMRHHQRSATKANNSDSATGKNSPAGNIEAEVAPQRTVDGQSAGSSYIENTSRNSTATVAVEAGLEQSALIDRSTMVGRDESVENPGMSGQSVSTVLNGSEENDAILLEQAEPVATAAALSALDETVESAADGFALAQQQEPVNAVELGNESPLTQGNGLSSQANVGDVISQAELAAHYQQFTNTTEKGLSEQSSTLPKSKSELVNQPVSLRLADNDLLSAPAAQNKLAVLHSDDQSLESTKVRGRALNGVAETISSTLKEQGRSTHLTAEQLSVIADSTSDMSQRKLQIDAQTLAKMNEEAVLQRNFLTQSTPSMINAVLPDASSHSGSQSGENMFLSAPGGIVTAPLQARQSTDSLLTMNAPLNVSLLADDADKAMASNIRWMVDGGVKNAVVNVTPNGMGPISVQIGIDKEQMNVSIIAVQGSTREALDSMLPRLREQLIAQGHDSVRVDVSDGRSEHSRGGNGQAFTNDRGQAFSDSEEHGSGLGRDRIDSSVASDNHQHGVPDKLTSDVYARSNASRYDLYV